MVIIYTIHFHSSSPARGCGMSRRRDELLAAQPGSRRPLASCARSASGRECPGAGTDPVRGARLLRRRIARRRAGARRSLQRDALARLLVPGADRGRRRAREPPTLRPRRLLLRPGARSRAASAGCLRFLRPARDWDRGPPRRALGPGVRWHQHAMADRDGRPADRAPRGHRTALGGEPARARAGRRADAARRRPGAHPEARRGRRDPRGASARRDGADALPPGRAHQVAGLARYDRRLARGRAQRSAPRVARNAPRAADRRAGGARLLPFTGREAVAARAVRSLRAPQPCAHAGGETRRARSHARGAAARGGARPHVDAVRVRAGPCAGRAGPGRRGGLAARDRACGRGQRRLGDDGPRA